MKMYRWDKCNYISISVTVNVNFAISICMFLAVVQLNATRRFNELGSESMENYVRWFSKFSDIKRIVASWLGIEKFLRNLDPIWKNRL